MNQSKTVVQQTHFDPWGNRMSYAAWNTPQTQTSFTFDRGFTGHEHYDCMHVINANARLYDPVIGRFFSPDPYVQTPDFTQAFNRYSYCMNNPVMYSDPDGEIITWSISKDGFSFGINFTPFGIPLGVGANIGWSQGFTMGVYGEAGFRVGGSGFGSGITVSQSIDYNFNQNSWSTTTSEGAYASIGLFNAGFSFSQTYDQSTNIWSSGWGINAGVGFGNDGIGLGITIGYGSNGFTYGLGGYYNSHAWDNNPTYEPEKWNDEGIKQITNNCYSYALDEIDNGNFWGIQPGDIGGNPLTDINLNNVLDAALSDGRIKKPNIFNKMGFGKKGYYSVYLVIADGIDYHWYRQDKGGMWSHKPGITPVINKDASGHGIYNPAYINHNYPNVNYCNGGILLWVRRK